ncbi:MAG: hypothetical protein EBR82_08140 [Caulobacteraceae bacterium]|nr:hypothetical protein [Caulobacteraceae bacterium]
MTAVLGVDPGKTGAMARYSDAHDSLEILDMPTLVVAKGKKTVTRIDAVALAFRLQQLASRGLDLIVLEQPMAMPGQNSASVFDIGRSFGMIEGIIGTLKIRCEIAHPAAWKRTMKCGAAKDSSIARATQLLPQHAQLWPLKKHADRCEAALLALYGIEHLLPRADFRPSRTDGAAGKGTTPS